MPCRLLGELRVKIQIDNQSENKLPYQTEWKLYRKLGRKVYFLFSLLIIWLFFGGFLLSLLALPQNSLNGMHIALFMIGGLVLSYVLYRFNEWKCPRCLGSYFFYEGGKAAMPWFQTECQSCGLSRYEGSTFYKAPVGLNLKK